MGGLTGPEASTGEKIASWALPIGAGLAAAVHPAGARGLAGVTSAINTGLYARQINRQEEEDRALGRNITSLLDRPGSIEGRTGALAEPEAAGISEGVTVQPSLKQVLGREGELVRTLAGTPGTARSAATLLSSIIAPKPNYHIQSRWNQDKNANELVAINMADPTKPPIPLPGMGQIPADYMPPGVRAALGMPEQAPPPPPEMPSVPARNQQGQLPIPYAEPAQRATIPTPPPSAAPAAPAGPMAPGPGVAAPGPSPRPTATARWDPQKGWTYTLGQGEVQTTWKEAPYQGRNYIWALQTDPKNPAAVYAPRPVIPAPSPDARQRIEDQVRAWLPDDDPNFLQAVYETSAVLGTPGIDQQTAAAGLSRIRRKYAGGTQPTVAPSGVPGATRPAEVPGPPARTTPPAVPGAPPSGAPVTGGAAAPAPSKSLDPTELQAEGARVKSAQEAAAAGAKTTATEAAQAAFPPKAQDATLYRHKKTWSPPPSNMSLTQIQQSSDYAPINQQSIQAVAQARVVKGMFGEIDQIMARRPDLYPTTTGDKVKDAYNLTKATAYFKIPGIAKYDRDLARLEAITAALPTLVKAFGDTANIAVAERYIAERSIGLTPSMRDAAQARIDTLRGFMNEAMSGNGLEPSSVRPLRAATQGEYARARRDAKGDPAKTREILKDMGIDTTLDMVK